MAELSDRRTFLKGAGVVAAAAAAGTLGGATTARASDSPLLGPRCLRGSPVWSSITPRAAFGFARRTAALLC